MVDVGIGALGYFGYGKESTEGTGVAPTKFLPATSINFNDSNDYLTPLTIRKSRDTSIAMPAPYITQGTVEMPLVIDDIGMLIKSAFAATISSSQYLTTSAYTHVITPSSTSQTFSIETSAQDLLIMRYTGVRVNTLELRAAFGEIVTATWGFDGISRAKQAGTTTATYAATSVTPLHFTGASVTVNAGNPYAKDVTLSVNNNVEHIGSLNATRSYSRVAMGQRDINLSMSMDFQSSSDYDLLLNDTEFAVNLLFTGPTIAAGASTYLQVNLPRVKYRTVGVPISAGDFISQDVECTVLKPTSGDVATVTLRNNEATATLA